MEFVHHCAFCGWHAPARSTAMLRPHCESCGSLLHAESEAEFARGRPERHAPVPLSRNSDITGLFGILVGAPFLLPLLGVKLGDVAFAIPLVTLAFACQRSLTAARRRSSRREVWWALTATFALGTLASGMAIFSAVVTGSVGDLGFYVGGLASITLLVAVAALVRPNLRAEGAERFVDAFMLASFVATVGAFLVVIPGFTRGNALLTTVFLVDLAALIVAALAIPARRGRHHRRIGWWLLLVCASATVGDGLVAAAATGDLAALPALTAVLWAVAGYVGAYAADIEIIGTEPGAEPEVTSRRSLVTRLVIPCAVVLSCALATALSVWGDGPAWQTAYFGAAFVASLVLAFGRQAWLLIDNQRWVDRERRTRQEVLRRNKELEALTSLATTMTQTLEEGPITEQALSVLHLAARATSSALHAHTPDGFALAATIGDWSGDHVWAGAPVYDGSARISVTTRGGRQIVRLPLQARGNDIGVVTLVRPIGDTFDGQELDLLGLLVDEMAVALQNARDYREKLEQAIRDPLTGLYNRRFFLEALEKEVQRSERYGSEASLVIFDVDDFKLINDQHGHAAGDEFLRRIGEIVEELIRPVDSFARIGGEEFALLLPETRQLDGLLIAERMRTAISRHAILPDRRVTVSGGVASCPHDAVTRDGIQQEADAALYWAKRHGKDMCAVASEVTAGGEASEHCGVLAHLYALVDTIDGQQHYTRDHSENVAAYAVALGQALGLDRDHVMRLRRAALLHDVGKVAVNGDILTKPEPLPPDEQAEVRLHPVVGASMLRHAGLGDDAVWVRHHHECFDGAGYPDGIAGEAIPLEARIIFAADSFEAMTSDRPYRGGVDVEDALAELHRCAGTQFDPAVVEALVGLVERGELAVLAVRGGGVSAA